MLAMISRIEQLKKQRQAIILAHNYQRDEVQDIADYVGDSLGLAQTAAKTDAKVIVFCGVHFMAETAKIVSPKKKVILPDLRSGCPLADMVTAEDVKKLRIDNPGAGVVCYINTSADVKAECDICCTSSNAVEVVESLPVETVIFVPDRNLGSYVSKRTKKKMILWEGFCPTHENLKKDDIIQTKKEFPQAEFVAHPECRLEVLELADRVASTSGIIKYVKSSQRGIFIIGTEIGLLHRLKKENPDKYFIAASKQMFCRNMKYNNLELLYSALENEGPEINVQPDTIKKAQSSIRKMLDIKRA